MPKTATAHASRDDNDQGLYSGLIRIHVLYHACKEPIFGLSMIEELARHGYRMSAGTLYPLLHGLERKGLLRSSRLRLANTARRVYRATPVGRRTLIKVRAKVEELLGELLENKGLPAQQEMLERRKGHQKRKQHQRQRGQLDAAKPRRPGTPATRQTRPHN